MAGVRSLGDVVAVPEAVRERALRLVHFPMQMTQRVQ